MTGPATTPWFAGDQHPARRGWYERDHRQCAYQDPADRGVCCDWWEPVNDRRSIIYPGVWYVRDRFGLNDASHQNLPWRGLTEYAGPVVPPWRKTPNQGAL